MAKNTVHNVLLSIMKRLTLMMLMLKRFMLLIFMLMRLMLMRLMLIRLMLMLMRVLSPQELGKDAAARATSTLLLFGFALLGRHYCACITML